MHDRLKRGIVLPVAIAVLFLMLVLALGLADMGRRHAGFTLLMEYEGRQLEASEIVFGDMQSILQGELPPATLSMSSAPPVPGGGTVSFQGPAAAEKGGVSILSQVGGAFNSRTLTESINRPLPGPAGFNLNAQTDGYESPLKATSTVPVPTRHALIFTAASDSGQPASMYAAVMSSNFPYGMLAPNGAISVVDARSVHTYVGADGDETGLPVYLSALQDITVAQTLVGRGYCSHLNLGNVSIGMHGGGYPPVKVPNDFETALSNARQKASQGLFNLGPLLTQLHDCNHQNIPTNNRQTAQCSNGIFLSQNNPGDADVSTVTGPGGDRGVDLDSSLSTLTVGADFMVPAGAAVQVPFSMTVQGNLVMGDHSVLYVGTGSNGGNTASLGVRGRIYINQLSTIVVDGVVTCMNALDVYATPRFPSLTSTLIAGDNIALGAGMTHTSDLQIGAGTPFSAKQCPFPPSTIQCLVGKTVVTEQVPNPNCDTFSQQATQCAQMLAPLAKYFPAVTPGSADPVNVPGVFVDSDKSITIKSVQLPSGSLTRASGLFVGGSDVSFNSPTPQMMLVGAAWSRGGSVNAGSAIYRSYPYYTHATVHTASADLNLSATHYHVTAFGKWGTR